MVADGSFSRARRFGGWNSDSPPGLTATPNGGGGTCGTRRGNGGGDPPGAGGVRSTAGGRASGGTAEPDAGSRISRAGDVLTLSEKTDRPGSDDPGSRGGENQEYGWRAPRAGGSGSGADLRGVGTGGSPCAGT